MINKSWHFFLSLMFFVLCLNFNVNGAGFHIADEIVSGNFTGHYDFDNLPTVDGDSLQMGIFGSCSAGSSIRVIGIDGSVTCEIDSDTQTNFSILNASYLNVDEVNSITSAMIVDGSIKANDIDSSQIQLRVNGTCAVGSSIRAIASDGTVTCEVDSDVDTNAASLCDDGYFLNGDNTCDPVVVDTNTQLSEATVDSYVSNNGYLTSYSETDPQVGTMTNGKWCRSDGSKVICDVNTVTDTNTQLSEATVDSYVSNNGYLSTSGDYGRSGVSDYLYMNSDTYFYRDTTNRIRTPDTFYVDGNSAATYLYSTNTYLGASSGDTIQLRGNTFTGTNFRILNGEVRAASLCDESGNNCNDLSAGLGGSVDTFTAGDYLLHVNSAQYSSGFNNVAGVWLKIKETKIPVGGALRISYKLKSSNAAATAYARIYRNGAPVGTIRSTSSTSTTTYTEDVSGWSKGDYLQVYGYSSINGFYTSYVSDLSISVGDNSDNYFLSLT